MCGCLYLEGQLMWGGGELLQEPWPSNGGPPCPVSPKTRQLREEPNTFPLTTAQPCRCSGGPRESLRLLLRSAGGCRCLAGMCRGHGAFTAPPPPDWGEPPARHPATPLPALVVVGGSSLRLCCCVPNTTAVPASQAPGWSLFSVASEALQSLL